MLARELPGSAWDYGDAIDALDESIDTRARENEGFPDGKKNGTQEERDDFDSKQRHRERQHEEQRLRDRLERMREDHRRGGGPW